MTDLQRPPLSWEAAFLAAKTRGMNSSQAARAAGVHQSTPYNHKRKNLRFAREWTKASAIGGKRKVRLGRGRMSARWKARFIELLGETSNVTAAADSVNVPTRTVYRMRRDDPAFAADWLVALCEGYDNLEMELLGHLRDPKSTRKLDVAVAMRLLAAHRDTVTRQRTLIGATDQETLFARVDTFLEDMRQRRAANTALLIEAKDADDE